MIGIMSNPAPILGLLRKDADNLSSEYICFFIVSLALLLATSWRSLAATLV